jgi:hypothetical protein
MATAKTTEAIATDVVATAEAVQEVKVEKGKLYKFESSGKSKYLKKGKRYILTAELYQLFVKKGYGK